MELEKTSWLENFNETCQDILEDAFLLDALSVYLFSDGEFLREDQAGRLPLVLRRLCGYLSQHALDLQQLGKRIGAQGF